MRPPVIRDRVTTTSNDGKRIRIFPMAPPVRGFFNQNRIVVQWTLIALYLVLPWIKISGHPALLLDLEHRRFSIFGKLFFAHEAPILFLFAIIFLMSIALITVILGRVWCGWACPQTVFVERVFRKIDGWIIGDHLAQNKLHYSSWNTKKVFLVTIKWVSYFLVTLLIAHSLLAYFVGGSNSFSWMLSSPTLHPQAFFWTWLVIAVLLFDFGWFREQFCLIACPYGRFQSVMMDEGSLYLAYDSDRGDCIDCLKCVKVCPTGIDVRNGLQFECIACTACADACDSVMKKIGKPKKLIGYGSRLSLTGKKPNIFRGRTVVYGAILFAAIGALIFQLSFRKVLQVEISRAKDFPYQVAHFQNQDVILNRFILYLHNLDWNDHVPKILLSEESKLNGFEGIESAVTQGEMIPSTATKEAQYFIKITKESYRRLKEKKLDIVVDWDQGSFVDRKEVTFVGPD